MNVTGKTIYWTGRALPVQSSFPNARNIARPLTYLNGDHDSPLLTLKARSLKKRGHHHFANCCKYLSIGKLFPFIGRPSRTHTRNGRSPLSQAHWHG